MLDYGCPAQLAAHRPAPARSGKLLGGNQDREKGLPAYETRCEQEAKGSRLIDVVRGKTGRIPPLVKLRETMTKGSVRGKSKMDGIVKMVFLAPTRAILSEREFRAPSLD